MTTARRDGNDSPFGAWLRGRRDLDSVQHGIVASDIDWVIRKYKNVTDSVGTRPVHLILELEVKTFGAMPNLSQRETLFFKHLCCSEKRLTVPSLIDPKKKISIWHLGFYILGLDEDRPMETVRWYQFSKSGELLPSIITADRLADILGFRVKPDNPYENLSLRRHHKTSMLEVEEIQPLGFAINKHVVKRS